MLERRQKQNIEQFIRENLSGVLDFTCNILESDLPRECYLEALIAAKSWCQFSTATFVPSPRFVELVFRLLQTDLSAKAFNVVRKLLTVSKFAK